MLQKHIGGEACKWVLLLVGVLFLSSPSFCLAWRGKVVSVPEGDMLVVADAQRQQQVRIYGIECPVKGQPFWDKARVLTAHLINQKVIEVTPLYRGPDGFENVLIKIDGVRDYLNVQLVAHGMAWVKPNECSANLCAEWKAVERLARMNTIGLWAELYPVPPWEWKKQQRLRARKQQDSTKESSSADPD